MSLPTHEGDITVNVFLSPSPVKREGFGTGVIIDEQADSNLDGNQNKAYTGTDAMQSDVDNGFLNQNILDKGEVWFGQDPTVPEQDKLIVANYDAGSGDTLTDAIDDLASDRGDWYFVMIDSRSDADLTTVANHIESNYTAIFVAQSSATDWTNANPSGGTIPDDLAELERTITHFHPQDSEHQDVAHAANRGVFSPDDTSPPWIADIQGVNLLDRTQYTQSELNNVIGNFANVALPFGDTDTFVKRGTNMAGRQAGVLVTRDWFRARLQTDVALEIQKSANFGEKIPVSPDGQVRMAKLVRKRFSQGVEAGHFLPGSTQVRLPDITDADVNNQRIPLEGSATLAIAAQDVNFTFRFLRN
jgi:hypothetical protein